MKNISLLLAVWCMTTTGFAQPQKPRARDLGIPFAGTPGKYNAITDVAGVEVGFKTLIEGQGKLVHGKGPVRTGVTVIFPRGKNNTERCFAGLFALNGNGEMTGSAWVKESGFLGTPVVITNTHSVGTVRDAVIEWYANRLNMDNYDGDLSLPVVTETWDGFLNDINGFHIQKDHVFEAMRSAKSGPVDEGNVGGGTGMIVHQFKGGTGTSSRKLDPADGGFTVGVLVQANYGQRRLLKIAGVPVGLEIPDLMPQPGKTDKDQGSIIVVVATDAPLLPHQLERIAKRVSLGIAMMGGRGGNSSGDLFIAFSTANAKAGKPDGVAQLDMLPNEKIDPIFEAVADATEESIVNAMVAAETMEGINGNKVYAIPHERLTAILKKYNRLGH